MRAGPGLAQELLAAIGPPDEQTIGFAVGLRPRYHPSGQMAPGEAANAGGRAKEAYVVFLRAGFAAVEERARGALRPDIPAGSEG